MDGKHSFNFEETSSFYDNYNFVNECVRPIKDYAPSFNTQVTLRDKLISGNILQDNGSEIVFLQDYIFSSPSAASNMIKGNSSNGWIEWKNKKGKTLDELIRR